MLKNSCMSFVTHRAEFLVDNPCIYSKYSVRLYPAFEWQFTRLKWVQKEGVFWLVTCYQTANSVFSCVEFFVWDYERRAFLVPGEISIRKRDKHNIFLFIPDSTARLPYCPSPSLVCPQTPAWPWHYPPFPYPRFSSESRVFVLLLFGQTHSILFQSVFSSRGKPRLLWITWYLSLTKISELT